MNDPRRVPAYDKCGRGSPLCGDRRAIGTQDWVPVAPPISGEMFSACRTVRSVWEYGSMKDISDQNNQDGLRALHLLLERRSVATLEDPPPTAAEVNLILDAGLRAPDHGRLRPWRFVLIRREARTAFGHCLVAAARKRDPSAPQSLLDRYQAWTASTPLLIAVGAKVSARHFIPEVEQVLSAGAAAMNMLNAVHLLGYGGIWVTGPNSYDPDVNACLGFHSPDRLVGLLAIGTARTTTTKVKRPPRAPYVAEWTGPAQASPN